MGWEVQTMQRARQVVSHLSILGMIARPRNVQGRKGDPGGADHDLRGLRKRFQLCLADCPIPYPHPSHLILTAAYYNSMNLFF